MEKMSLNWSAVCVKYLMFIFNLLFVITGIIILSAGVSVKAYFFNYESFMDDKYFSAPNLLIAIGAIIFMIAFFGCCGAIKENYCMTITFTSLMILICVLELAAGISGYVLRNETGEYLDDKLTNSLKKYNANGSDEITKVWDRIQNDFTCCGAHNASDWTNPTIGTGGIIPMSCCTPMPGAVGAVKCELNSPNLHHEGCIEAFGDYLRDHAVTIGGVGIGFCIVQVLGIMFACHLSRKLRDNYQSV